MSVTNNTCTLCLTGGGEITSRLMVKSWCVDCGLLVSTYYRSCTRTGASVDVSRVRDSGSTTVRRGSISTTARTRDCVGTTRVRVHDRRRPIP
jgi:hypothetical protein